MDLNYLYLNNSVNIEDINIDENFILQNEILNENCFSLTKNEIYYFELLDNHMKSLFSNINQNKDILLQKKSNFLLQNIFNNLNCKDINSFLNFIINLNTYFVAIDSHNNELSMTNDVIDKFSINNIIPKYKLVFAYLYLCNIFKYYQNIGQCIVDDIIYICKKFFNVNIINDILQNIQSCIIKLDKPYFRGDFGDNIETYTNYNKLITKAIMLYKYDCDYMDEKIYKNLIFTIGYILRINDRLLKSKVINYNNLLYFADVKIEQTPPFDIYIPPGLSILFIIFFNELMDYREYNDFLSYIFGNCKYIESLTNAIIDVNMRYNKEFNHVLFIQKLFDDILVLYNNFFVPFSLNKNTDRIKFYWLEKLDLFFCNFIIIEKYKCNHIVKKFFNNIKDIINDLMATYKVSFDEKCWMDIYKNNGSDTSYINDHNTIINKLYNKYFYDYTPNVIISMLKLNKHNDIMLSLITIHYLLLTITSYMIIYKNMFISQKLYKLIF